MSKKGNICWRIEYNYPSWWQRSWLDWFFRPVLWYKYRCISVFQDSFFWHNFFYVTKSMQFCDHRPIHVLFFLTFSVTSRIAYIFPVFYSNFAKCPSHQLFTVIRRLIICFHIPMEEKVVPPTITLLGYKFSRRVLFSIFISSNLCCKWLNCSRISVIASLFTPVLANAVSATTWLWFSLCCTCDHSPIFVFLCYVVLEQKIFQQFRWNWFLNDISVILTSEAAVNIL